MAEEGSRNSQENGKEIEKKATRFEENVKISEKIGRNIEENEQEIEKDLTVVQENVKEEGMESTESQKVEEEVERDSSDFEKNEKVEENEQKNVEKNEQEIEKLLTDVEANEKAAGKESPEVEQVGKESREFEKNDEIEEIEKRNCENEHEEVKWIMHYSSKQRILLVGEGDFSFAACLAREFGNASNMVATSLDSKTMVRIKHITAINNLEELKKLGCLILHEINAHTMSGHSVLKREKFDRIVYNFPHAGFKYTEFDPIQIKLHRELVSGFFKNARRMLRKDGEVHVTHKMTYPFDTWKVDKLAEEQGLVLVDRAWFCIHFYPGYLNRRGDGRRSDETFRVGHCVTFKFRLDM